MPKIFEAPFYTEEELKEMDESELTFPFSTEYMRYDGVKQQYIPTEELLTKHGIDLTGFLTSTGRNTPQNVNEELTGSALGWSGIFLSKTVERTRGPPSGIQQPVNVTEFRRIK